MRKDLKMRRGKEIAQGSHASIAFLTRKLQRFWADLNAPYQPGGPVPPNFDIYFTHVEREWINGIFAKVCVRVNSEEELLEIERKAREAGLEVHLITDSGKTEFAGVPTNTCLAIGPDEASKIDAITGHLELY
jgi:PTH2 family peptidyl-tRNA hydrolase